MGYFELQGSYHNKSILGLLRQSRYPVNTITIFAHGLYGMFDECDMKDRVNMLAERLLSNGISHTVQYSSSRDFDFDGNTDYKERQKAFEGKTFNDELVDLKRVIAHAIENSEKLFGIKRSDLRLYVHGNSLGGTLAVLLEEYYPSIKKLSLCGSGCGSGNSQKPIVSTMFPEELILDVVSEFTGELLLLQGSEDTVVPKESGLKIIRGAKKARVAHVEVPGANHNFSALYGKEGKKARELFVSVVFDFLSK